MRKVEITVYTLAELKARAEAVGDDDRYGATTPEGHAYAKALDKLTEWSTGHDWWKSVYERWAQRLEALGFEDVKIQFRGFWSQGDGASFTAEYVDLGKFIREHYEGHEAARLLRITEASDATAKVTRHSFHYAHPNTVGANLDAYDGRGYTRIEKRLRDLEDHLTEMVRDLSYKIYRDLEEEYEYLTSEEALLEFAEANEYEFLADGSFAP